MVTTLPAGAVAIWMQKLKNGAYRSIKILERCLLTLMTKDEASQAVENAIKAGILVPKEKGAFTKGKQVMLCFPQKLSKHKSLKYDPYCFECQLPSAGPVQKCLLCTRSFHADCQRKKPIHPNYSVPSDRCQPHRLPLNESDMEESSSEDGTPNDRVTPPPRVAIEQEATYEVDCNSNINIISRNSFKHEPDSADDVYFVSEQPARQRKRCSPYIKSEQAPDNEANDDLQLCTPCRLLKLADLLNPPHMSIDELNCLLNYAWQKHHSWIDRDVRKHMTRHWSEGDSNIVKNLLFKNDMLGISDISHSIEMKEYKHLSQFLIDVLDLQHNIGVFFGTKCEEYNATKWLVRDITHDIREISRCSDCYRHSMESSRSAFWFAKPCTQRHELVYAKQQGSPYWPAKIIRVMSKKSNIFDVRFFGGDHSRALIPARDILPIDADISKLKIKATRPYNAAMREYQCHTMLLHQPMHYFSFSADPRDADNLINRALSHCMEAIEVSSSNKRPRAATPASAKKRKRATAVATPNLSQRLQPNRRSSIAEGQETLQDITLQLENSVASSPVFEMQGGRVSNYQELIQEVFTLNEQLTRNKAELDNLRDELKAVKRKRWCQHCLDEAEFDCCFTASYCSDACKRRDKRRHQGTCTHNGQT
ncbi:zinc finger MYND domain-containing protein 11 [Drosophila innubila]|uniref:zinc finger MYND domain-containing protein 11 n=1 Tax=Drosophila innubila TaxID=198719 RepID=UPI00148BB620|nr:zinc finger MYND domain-containing protein 11 [Drosophila innubila]